jgi:hypothetical protein
MVVVVVDYRCNSIGRRWIYRKKRRGRHVGLGVWFEGSKRVNAVWKKRSPIAWLALALAFHLQAAAHQLDSTMMFDFYVVLDSEIRWLVGMVFKHSDFSVR